MPALSLPFCHFTEEPRSAYREICHLEVIIGRKKHLITFCGVVYAFGEAVQRREDKAKDDLRKIPAVLGCPASGDPKASRSYEQQCLGRKCFVRMA